MSVALTYYDHRRRAARIKRRYVWAFWAFAAGSLTGFATAATVLWS